LRLLNSVPLLRRVAEEVALQLEVEVEV